MAAADDPARLAWGFVKTLAISLPSYWFYRYIVSERDPAYARKPEFRAVTLWGIIYLMMAGLTWLGLFGPSVGEILGLRGTPETVVKVVLVVAQTILGIYFMAWFVAWSQGNASVGPLRSMRIMHGFFWRTVALMLAGIVPLMALHYAGLFAVGRPEPLVWAVMFVDSFVVGFLALTMFGVNAIAAKRAAEAKGVSLLSAKPSSSSVPELNVQGQPSGY